MSLSIHINDLILKMLKIKLLMPYQIVALIILIILDNDFSHFTQLF